MFNNARHVFSIRPRHSHAVFNGPAKYINSGFRRKNAFVKAGASPYMFTLSHARQERGSKMEYLRSGHTARLGPVPLTGRLVRSVQESTRERAKNRKPFG